MASETKDPIRRRLSKRFQVSLVWEGALVGLLGGSIVTLYRLSLTWAEKTMRSLSGLFSLLDGLPLLRLWLSL